MSVDRRRVTSSVGGRSFIIGQSMAGSATLCPAAMVEPQPSQVPTVTTAGRRSGGRVLSPMGPAARRLSPVRSVAGFGNPSSRCDVTRPRGQRLGQFRRTAL